MKVFEFYINPKAKKDVIYDSFVYEPKNVFEKSLGTLRAAGELTNVLPQNSESHVFLNKLAQIIKNEHYAADFDKNSEIKSPAEAGLKRALKKANEFLGAEVKKGNVNWLGNLNFAVLNFDGVILNFTKIGDIKILLLRSPAEIMDISANLEFQNTEPLPLKVFGNIVVGKLALNDKIIVLTKDAFELFTKTNLIKELTLVSEEKEIKKIFKAKKDMLSEISGICLLVFLGASQKGNGEQIKKYFRSRLTGIGSEIGRGKKLLISVLLLILILIAGFFIFKQEKEQKLDLERQVLEETRLKIIEAENALIFKDGKRAEILFQEARQKILPLSEEKSPPKEKIQALMEEIEQGLASINSEQ